MVMKEHQYQKKGNLNVRNTYSVGGNWGGPGQAGPKRRVYRAKGPKW